jgi:hypothetical protein
MILLIFDAKSYASSHCRTGGVFILIVLPPSIKTLGYTLRSNDFRQQLDGLPPEARKSVEWREGKTLYSLILLVSMNGVS